MRSKSPNRVRQDGAKEMGRRLVEGRKSSGLTIAHIVANTRCKKSFLWRLEHGLVEPTSYAIDIITVLSRLYKIEAEPLLNLVGRCSVPIKEVPRSGKQGSSINNLTANEARELRRYLQILRGHFPNSR